jgi:hypothetical protein
MSDLARLQQALIAADRAGDTEAATKLAQAIRASQQPKAAPQAEPTEAESTSFGQAALIGAGRTVDRGLQGIKQMGLQVASPFSEGARAALEAQKYRMTADDEQYAKLTQARPGATMLGEIAPLMAAPMLGSGVGGAALSASLPGLISYGSAEERLKSGAMGAAGGAAGAAIGSAVGRALQPNRVTPGATQQSALDAAKRVGVTVPVGDVTGSKPVRWLQSTLADMPLSGGMAQKADAANKAAINQAANRAIGQAGEEVTEQTLDAARQQIGGTFSAILNPLQVTLDKPFRADVQAIVGSKVMRELRNESVDNLIDPFKKLPNAPVRVSGDWFQQNKTALNDAIRSAYTSGEVGKARALEAFEGALDRAATRSMGQKERAAYDVARKQWASLRTLETGKVVEGGNVMPGRLDSALNTRYKQAYKEGKLSGELADIAKLGQVYKPLPQSGTTPRAMYSGLAGGAAFVDPMTAATMLGAPVAAQKFLQSDAGRKYLTKGLLEVSPETEKWLMRAGGGLLGLPATVGASR